MMLRKPVLSAIAAAIVMAAAAPTGAKANVEAGALNCRSPGGVGFVVGSVLNFDCLFVPSYGGRAQHYVAIVHHVGLDLGFTQNISMGWAVFAPTRFLHYGDPLRQQMAAWTLARRSASASVPMRWWAAATTRLRCSRSVVRRSWD